jgi:hypothetical protein
MGRHSYTFKVNDNVVVIKGPDTGKKGKISEIKGLFTKHYVVAYFNGGDSGPLPPDYLSQDKRGW